MASLQFLICLILLYLSILENKTRFVEEVCEGALVVSDRKRTELLAELKERGYAVFQNETTNDEGVSANDVDSDDEDPVSDENMPHIDRSKGYEYLLGMKIWSLTFERAEELRIQRGQKAKELESLESTPPENIWLADLNAIEVLLDERDRALGVDPNKGRCSQAVNKTALLKTAGRKSREKVVDEVSSEWWIPRIIFYDLPCPCYMLI